MEEISIVNVFKTRGQSVFFDNVRKEEERKPSIALTGQAGRWSDTRGNDAVNSSSLAENSSITQSMCWAKKKGGGGEFRHCLAFLSSLETFVRVWHSSALFIMI